MIGNPRQEEKRKWLTTVSSTMGTAAAAAARLTTYVLDFNWKSSDHRDSPSSVFVGGRGSPLLNPFFLSKWFTDFVKRSIFQPTLHRVETKIFLRFQQSKILISAWSTFNKGLFRRSNIKNKCYPVVQSKINSS
jgi:hypothetical protein